MYPKFFPLHKALKKPYFNPLQEDDSQSEDSSQGHATTTFDPIDRMKSKIQLRLFKEESLEDQLEKLLRHAQKFDGFELAKHLEKLLKFLRKNPHLVNVAPKKFHSTSLELVLELGGPLHIIRELITLKATVRPLKNHLLKNIMPILEPNALHKVGMSLRN